MARAKYIESDKVTVAELFSEKFWFLIPEYQRPYVWNEENVNELLDDLWYAFSQNRNKEYFLGSLVLKDRQDNNKEEIDFNEYEVLDGQQRLTTLLLLLGVIRDLAAHEQLIDMCQSGLFQEKNEFKNIPERVKIIYKIRDKVEDFVKEITTIKDSTQSTYIKGNKTSKNKSLYNMSNNIVEIRNFLEPKAGELDKFAKFLFNKVVLIYVASTSKEDAFRLFTILNDRGIPLTSADILKSQNIGEIGDQRSTKKYAEMWESLEEECGEDGFNKLLHYVGYILLKEKIRGNILDAFENKIYVKYPQYKGKETIELLQQYKDTYEKVIEFNDFEMSSEFKNLVTILKTGIPSKSYYYSDYWVPPLLSYYQKFGDFKILEFLKNLEYKFVSDMIIQMKPEQRLYNISKIIEKIDYYDRVEHLLEDPHIYKVNASSLKIALGEDLYSKKIAKYVLLKYEYLMSDNMVYLASFNDLSMEHILPVKPREDSEWKKNFSDEDHSHWKNKLANLVLLSRKKNSRFSNLDFKQKKEKYLLKGVDIFQGSKIFLSHHEVITPEILKERQRDMIETLVANSHEYLHV